MEEIFLFTLNPYGLLGRSSNDSVTKSGLVLLEKLAVDLQTHDGGRTWIDLDVLGQALFERLWCDKDELQKSLLTVDEAPTRGHAVEANVVTYLCEAYRRCWAKHNVLKRRQSPTKDEDGHEIQLSDLDAIKECIVQSLTTAFLEPDLYVGQELTSQLSEVLLQHNDAEGCIVQMLEQLAAQLNKEDYKVATSVIHKLLDVIKKELQELPFMMVSDNQTRVLHYFVQSPLVSKTFILYNYPKDTNDGRAYGQSLLGIVLSKSCLPETEMGSYDFFEEPSKQPASVHSNTESRIWTGLEIVNEIGYGIFNCLFRVDAEVKHLTLMWIGDLFRANAGRGKMWTGEMGMLMANALASDALLLNLGGVLLRFCQPFTEGLANRRIMKIDPTYMACVCTVAEDARIRNVHLRDTEKETFLVPSEAKEMEGDAAEFGFVSDIFFLTHKCLDLGFRVCHEKFVKMNQELGRQQNMFRDLQLQGQASSSAAEMVQKRMEALMTRYLSLKAALLVPSAMEATMQLAAATSSWMVQVSLAPGMKLDRIRDLGFPLREDVPALLKCVPEFTVENVCEHLLLARRFCPRHFEQNGDYLPPLVDFILTFMGSPKWIKNPHLRARLAECLECLLPHHQQEGFGNSMGSFHREQLFMAHPHRLELVPTLLHVFVDIETTGQAVEFEMKFSYRRPMYDIMKYIWEMDEYREKFVRMAELAENHIDDEEAPLFLRFVNLLINDAIFLLDEALGYMKQIQEQQIERDTTWADLPANERSNNEAQLHHMGRLARYHNIMGTETIQMLDKLTARINAVFTQPSMVDRIAAMLNYFLKNLVGPQRKSFKVKNLDDFSFNPGEIVTDICKIYVNLKDCHSFNSAVSRDGRSYTPQLFDQAEDVLYKIGKAELAEELKVVATKVRSSADSQKADEELFADAPDEYLDAIMSHLMTDPVRLPNSGQIVDRSTIARHLLSDQNDPFTRAPLTMELVVPQDKLRQEIHAWMQQKRDALKLQ